MTAATPLLCDPMLGSYCSPRVTPDSGISDVSCGKGSAGSVWLEFGFSSHDIDIDIMCDFHRMSVCLGLSVRIWEMQPGQVWDISVHAPFSVCGVKRPLLLVMVALIIWLRWSSLVSPS